MALEKLIHGKKDGSHHAGKHSEAMRVGECESQIKEFEILPENPYVRGQAFEYFKLFEQKSASRNAIRDESPFMLGAVDMLVVLGEVTGQHTMGMEMEPDIIYTIVRKTTIDNRQQEP